MVDGRVFDSYSAPMFGPDEKYYGRVWYYRDITGHKQLEEQLRQSQKMEAVGHLTAGIAHNFNNILMSLMGNLELAVMDTSETRQRYLTRAQQDSERAADLVKQLLLFSRKTSVALQPIEIHAIVQDVVEICRKTFDRKLEITFECAPDLPPVLGDAGQIEQVFLNLCLNARDALTGLDQPGLHISIAVDVLHCDTEKLSAHPVPEEGRYIRIQVVDSGVGMDKETQTHIFEPFLYH